MFNVDEELQWEKDTASHIYKRGEEYFRGGRVKSVKFDAVNNQFIGSVIGSMTYKVSVDFDEERDFVDARCNCPAYGGYRSYCKHIVAMLLSIKSMQKPRKVEVKEKVKENINDHINSNTKTNIRPHDRAIADMINYFDSGVDRPVSLDMEVDCHLEVDLDSSYSSWTVNFSLRVGEGKLYRVRHIKDFINTLETKRPMVFGKNFTFDPNTHQFSEENRSIIDYLQELREYEDVATENLLNTKDSLFKGKHVSLPPSGTKRILNLMKGRTINTEINGDKYEGIPIVEESLPMEILLEKDQEGLNLKFTGGDLLFPITPDGEYFFAKNKIIKVPRQEQQYLSPLLKAINQSINSKEGRGIPIPQYLQPTFFRNVFPRILKTGKMKLSQEVEAIIESAELAPRVYLDTNGKYVKAKILFNYGNISINPFDQEKNYNPNNKVLIRDTEREEKLLYFFEELDFKVKKSEVYLENEEKIYQLVSNRINDLKELAEIYYSEAFRKLKIRESFTVMGRISLREDDLLEVSFEMEDISPQEVAEVLKALETKKKYYRLKDGTILQLETQGGLQVREILRQLSLQEGDFEEGFIKIPKYRGMLLDHMIEEEGFFEKDESFDEYIRKIKNPEASNFKTPATIEPLMRGYQKKGFHWIKTLAGLGLGGILADDMGLGKTLQMISAILADKEEGKQSPSLVVVPSSLLTNWQEEVIKFAPELKTLMVCGTPTEREKLIKTVSDYDLIITSYPLVQKDVKHYQEITFNYYILDEAQHIKNPTSKNARAVKTIQAKARFALTGTPIENSLTELWSIFDFILPKYLGGYNKFRETFEKPIIKDQDPKAYGNLTKYVKPFILRRMKGEVLQELPPKIMQTFYADLTSDQKRVYMATLSKIRGEIEEELNTSGLQKSHIKILAGLTRLRQICCHPALFLENYHKDSGKFELLAEILRDGLADGHRILIFSQFTGMLKMISSFLDEEKIQHKYLDGSTEVKDRGQIISEFNQGVGEVFLISLKAGGTGLNLTSADMVIHYDPWWNPAVEEQATDRAYRIGQEKVVHVIKLITKGTIEEKIVALQEKKKRLIDAVIQPGETMISKLTEQEIRELFDI